VYWYAKHASDTIFECNEYTKTPPQRVSSISRKMLKRLFNRYFLMASYLPDVCKDQTAMAADLEESRKRESALAKRVDELTAETEALKALYTAQSEDAVA
jgi:hypothetical protein